MTIRAELADRAGRDVAPGAMYTALDRLEDKGLIASRMSIEQIRAHIDADSLGYLSVDGLVEAIGLPESTLCNACFHGRYPMPIEVGQDKFALERT